MDKGFSKTMSLKALQRLWKPRTLVVIALLFALAAVIPAGAVRALSGGDVSITLISGDPAASPRPLQELVLDSNKPCTTGPRAAYVAFRIENTSGGTLTGVQATLGGFDTANGFNLTGGQPATLFIGTLAAGEVHDVYWYITYPCYLPGGSADTGRTDTLTITVSDDNTGTATQDMDVVTTRSNSANAGGQIVVTTLGPGMVIGQIVDYDVTYSFGNIDAGDDFYMQPSGQPTFNAGCFQLIASEVTNTDIPGIIPVGMDRLHYIAASSDHGTGFEVTVKYYFLVRCTGVTTTSVPYAAETSGSRLKYTGNFEAGGESEHPFSPAPTNPFTVDKQVSDGISPDPADTGRLAAGGTVTYTITVANTTDYNAYLDRIDDALPAGISFLQLCDGTGADPCSGSDVTAANSTTVPSPGDGNGATISFIGDPLNSYLIPAHGSIQLVYQATVTSTIGSYVNTATARNRNPTQPSGWQSLGQDSSTVNVGPESDLGVTKTDSPDPVTVGSNVTYTVTIHNYGPDDAPNVHLADTLPGSVTFVSATPNNGTSCDHTGGVIDCDLGTIEVDDEVIVTIVVTTTAPGTITNTATVDSDATEPPSDPHSNTAIASTTVNANADLSVIKTDTGYDPVTTGANVIYNVAVTNNGPGTAQNVVLTDTLPATANFVSATPGQGSCSHAGGDPGGTVTCNLGNMANGATVNVSIVVQTTQAGTMTNLSSVTSDTPDSNSGNNSESENTTVNAICDLGVDKTDLVDPVTVGNNVTYSVAVHNYGPDTAQSVVLTDTLPGTAAFVSATPDNGTSCSEAAGIVTCNLGNIDHDDTVTVTIVGTTTSTGTITNNASVTTTTTEPVPDPHSNSDSEDTLVNPSTGVTADLGITKTDASDPVTTGDNISYTVTVHNYGPNDVTTNVLAVDTLPGSVAFFSAAPSQGSCSHSGEATGGTVTCNLGGINNGAEATITIVVTTTQAGTISNSVTVSSDATDSVPDNNTATQQTTVNPLADLGITKTDSPDPVLVDNNVTYSVVVHNYGPDTAENVVLEDDLPGTVTFVSATPNNGTTCSYSYPTVTCNLGDLADGETVTVTVVVTTTETGLITNQASVTSDTSEPDTDPHSNLASTDTNVGALANLGVTKVDDPDPVTAGAQVTYTIQVNNGGPSTATSTVLTDTLPGTAAFVSATPDNGTSCSEAAGIVTCNLGDLVDGETVTVTIVVTTTQAGTLTNLVNVSTTAVDTDQSNNSASADTSVVSGPVPPPRAGNGRGGPAAYDPAISKAGDPSAAVVGETVTWTMVVWNPHAVTIYDVSFSDSLPNMFTIIGANATRGTVSVNGQAVTVDIGTLAPGEWVTITVETVVNELATPGQVCNVAYADGISATGCVTLYPGLLPSTGGRPLQPIWWGVGALAGAGLIAGGWMAARRRRHLLGRLP